MLWFGYINLITAVATFATCLMDLHYGKDKSAAYGFAITVANMAVGFHLLGIGNV